MNHNRNKKGLGSKIVSFAEDKGFYIILALCAVAIGVSGYVLFFTGDDADGDGNVTASNPVVEQQPQTTVPKVDVSLKDDEEEKPQTDSKDNEPNEATVSKPQTDVPVSNPVNIISYSLPVAGDVIRPFSNGELVYDETMGDWRTHNGTDFACAEGDRICAIADGKVTAVYTDPLMGNCVTIDHGNKVTSTYCGLTQNATMKVGMEVKAGDVIGGAGTSNISESAQAPHFHLEVQKNGSYIDPMSLKMK